MFNFETTEAIKRHAKEQFPKESCGVVVGDKYYPCKNIAEDPEQDFIIDPKDLSKAMQNGPVAAVLHSHPNGPMFPSQADMEGQIGSDVPWGIVPLRDDKVGDPFYWGANTPIPPIIGRQFQHGITDCYAVMRDVYRLGRAGCAEQGIDWPFEPVVFPEIPRDDNWWVKAEDDLYADNFEKLGFYKISIDDVKAGDVFLKAIKSEKLNHGGVYLGDGTLLHHKPFKLSVREPAGLWGRAADMWIRYGDAKYAS